VCLQNVKILSLIIIKLKLDGVYLEINGTKNKV